MGSEKNDLNIVKRKRYMKKHKVRRKIKYTNEPIGKIKIVDDFLPKPEELILKEESSKITIYLTKSSINFLL